MKEAQFLTKSPEEQRAIISLLYSFGYKKDNLTLDKCVDTLKEYPYIVIYDDHVIGANYTSYHRYQRNSFTVSDISITELVEFLTEKPSVLVTDFGDYSAEVFADELFIGGPGATVPFDQVKEIYDIIIADPIAFKELHITVKNDQERRFLIHALNSFGYTNRYRPTVEAWCNEWESSGYKSVVVYPIKKVGANGSYTDNGYPEYVFSRDMDELYPLLMGATSKKIEIEDIAGFDVEIHKDTVRVGCQNITYDKIKEAYAAMIKLQG
jgi:hypothetical protein